MERRVLVIGSNSFSGSDFVDLLLENPRNQVIGISRSPEYPDWRLAYKRHVQPRFQFQQCDLNHDMAKITHLLADFQPAYIVNFAAQSEVAESWQTPWDWFQTNTVGLSRLIDCLKDARYLKRYVHISSPEVYGTCEGVVKEEAPLNPSTPYAASKAAADLLLATYVKNFNFPLATVRSTNVYGAHQQIFKIIPRTIINLKKGSIQDLHGGGKAVKSYIHIRDISRGELLVMEQGRTGEIYHFSPDAGIAVRDVVKKICDRMGKDFHAVTREVSERLGQDKAYVIDSNKARRELGWAPRISLEKGLGEVIDWVNQYWSTIQEVPLKYLHRA